MVAELSHGVSCSCNLSLLTKFKSVNAPAWLSTWEVYFFFFPSSHSVAVMTTPSPQTSSNDNVAGHRGAEYGTDTDEKKPRTRDDDIQGAGLLSECDCSM
jgi:hypothetical protein